MTMQKDDLARIRTWNLLIRSQTRYPLRHEPYNPFRKENKIHKHQSQSMKPNGRKRASFCLENVQAKLERIAPIPVLLIKAISKQKDVRGARSALARRDITVKEERQKTNSQSTGTACFILPLCFVYRQAKLLPTHPFRRPSRSTVRTHNVSPEDNQCR